jgi:formyl-CoA transferase
VLFAANPRLIVVRISGWGQTGPFAGKPGFGSLVEAMSGFATMNGFPDRPPVLPPLALADMITGLYGATAIMIALRHVEVAGGAGQVIDLSLFESMLSVLGPQAANYALTSTVPARHGSRSGTTAPRNVYCCADGKYVALSASMQVMAERLFRVMGRPDLITDPRFATNTARVANNDTLDPIVAAFMAAHTQAEALAVFEQAGVTVGPVCDPADLMDSAFIREREALISLPDADMGRLPMHNIPARLSATPGAMARPAPALGAVVLATAAFAGIGLTMAGALRAEVTLAAANGLYLVLLLLGGMVFPLSHLPGGLADVARALPSAALSGALHSSLTGGGPGGGVFRVPGPARDR